MVMRAVIRAIPAIAVATFVVLFNTLVLFFFNYQAISCQFIDDYCLNIRYLSVNSPKFFFALFRFWVSWVMVNLNPNP